MQTKLPAPEILRSEGVEPENLLAFLQHALCVVLNLRVEVLSCRRCRLSARRLNGPCRRTHQHHDHADAEYVSSASCHLRSSSMKPARTAYRVVNSLAASVLRRMRSSKFRAVGTLSPSIHLVTANRVRYAIENDVRPGVVQDELASEEAVIDVRGKPWQERQDPGRNARKRTALRIRVVDVVGEMARVVIQNRGTDRRPRFQDQRILERRSDFRGEDVSTMGAGARGADPPRQRMFRSTNIPRVISDSQRREALLQTIAERRVGSHARVEITGGNTPDVNRDIRRHVPLRLGRLRVRDRAHANDGEYGENGRSECHDAEPRSVPTSIATSSPFGSSTNVVACTRERFTLKSAFRSAMASWINPRDPSHGLRWPVEDRAIPGVSSAARRRASRAQTSRQQASGYLTRKMAFISGW